jgi:hypothetical protein
LDLNASDDAKANEAAAPARSTMSVQQLLAAAECLAKDSSVDHRVLALQFTREPQMDNTAKEEVVARLCFQQWKNRG